MRVAWAGVGGWIVKGGIFGFLGFQRLGDWFLLGREETEKGMKRNDIEK